MRDAIAKAFLMLLVIVGIALCAIGTLIFTDAPIRQIWSEAVTAFQHYWGHE